MSGLAVIFRDDDHGALLRLAARLQSEDASAADDVDVLALERIVERLAPTDETDREKRVELTANERDSLLVTLEVLRGAADPGYEGGELLERLAHRHRVVSIPVSLGQPAIGERAWLSQELGAPARDALAAACMILTDELIDSVCQFRPDRPFTQTPFGSRLPVRPYPADFPRRMLACLMQLVGKLGSQTPPTPCCVAEEICAYLILEHAHTLAAEEDSPWHSEDAEYELEIFDILEDTDFLLLWDPTTPAPPVEGWTIAPDAAIDEWFEPFNASRGEVHPYANGSRLSRRSR